LILVTGASGFIGGHLTSALLADGHAVRALVRTDGAANRVPQGAEVVRGDVADVDSLRAAAVGVRLVYHLAGSYRGTDEELHVAHVTGTANLLRALEPGTRVVYVSSTSVYGWDQVWPADHATPPAPASAYGKAKLAAEELVLGAADIQAVVARPTITYGPGDDKGMLARAYSLMRRGAKWFPGDGNNRIHLLHVDDLVRALLVLGDTGEGVYVLGGPSATPVRRILGCLAEGAGLEGPSFGLPPALFRPLARHAVDVLTRDRAYSSARAIDDLDWEPQVDVEDGLRATGAWLATGSTGTTTSTTPTRAWAPSMSALPCATYWPRPSSAPAPPASCTPPPSG